MNSLLFSTFVDVKVSKWVLLVLAEIAWLDELSEAGGVSWDVGWRSWWSFVIWLKMVVDQLVCEGHVWQDQIKNFFVWIVLFQTLLEILQVSHKADITWQWSQLLRSLLLLQNHGFEGLFFKFIECIISISCCFIRLRSEWVYARL